ncbi:hypothetical protein H6G97_19705 [Nostoc flagelliforme FACHB-838]|uniref:pPIWI-RE three-gene island domain-containing protein n=1 Tax=Nostoc flagelliforme FACHB-838 TaxID=2692904 RepID=A0ABR8DQF3_9NOSO|nr:hypothetical protein [Nostoc flagelliforme]MBD2531697.1 hypothetical protein [Nostoc flagelliforme FACHB-838]
MRTKPKFWKGAERICWLCVFMEEFIGTNSLEYAPVVMSGMASILNAPAFEKARQAIFNMRQMSLAYVTNQSVKHAIALFNNYHYCNNTKGTYEIDIETLHFQRTDPLENSSITQARQILSTPLPYETYGFTVADPRQPMAVALGEESTAVQLPIPRITAPIAAHRTHSLNRQPKGKILIPLRELRDLAREMDEREKQDPERRPGNWADRFERFDLMVSEAGKGLRKQDDVLELEDIKHLIGLPGSGKTTLLVLIAVWLGLHNYKAMFVFPSIEVARQYMADLAFHQVKVGMLVGQGDETRRRHADNIAEAIAATGNNGGFAYTLEQAEVFGMSCVLPAFSTADMSLWGFSYAPCNEILQGGGKQGKMKKCLCPLWTMCGRNKAQRDLLDANIWVGHVRSLDTQISPHAIQEEVRYFELIARTFDLVVFDEGDMVQNVLDNYGAATLSISGSERSIHRVILEQIHNRFAGSESHRLFDRDVELYSRDSAEFGNYNTSLITTVQNMSGSRVRERYENQLLTVLRIVSELLNSVNKSNRQDEIDEQEVKREVTRSRALAEFWEKAAYNAFYDRTGVNNPQDFKADFWPHYIGINKETLEQQWKTLIHHFRRYLAENLIKHRDAIVQEIIELFFKLCFPDHQLTIEAEDLIKLLITVTFVILGYQRIVPGTRTMVAEGLIREPIVESTASPKLRKIIPESILGSFSGVQYSFFKALTTRTAARNVELSYITFVGAPRMLMHRFHRLLAADDGQASPAILITSATSFLQASPAYHINVGPHYLLKPRQSENNKSAESIYRFKWFPDRERGDEPLKYSGAGDLQKRNLLRMVAALVGGTKPEIYKSMDKFDIKFGIRRKAALVVNSYDQARDIKKYINDYHPQIGKHTKAVVNSLKEGEQPKDFVTSAQCEALGDDENCHILIFPMLAIGRGVNIVFTKGERKLDAAIGSIYFLTRPHPTKNDMQLLYSLAGRATQEFDSRVFSETEDLNAIATAWQQSRKNLWLTANRLLREPLMASRLGPELFKSFTANQMVAILQTIGRGMRNGCPVSVYFVDAAWAKKSTEGKPDSGRDSMLIQMRIILEECVNHEDPVIREIYQELYGAFLKPLQRIQGIIYPDELCSLEESADEEEGFDEFSPLLEM